MIRRPEVPPLEPTPAPLDPPRWVDAMLCIAIALGVVAIIAKVPL